MKGGLKGKKRKKERKELINNWRKEGSFAGRRKGRRKFAVSLQLKGRKGVRKVRK